MSGRKWHVKTWMGRVIFDGKTFDSFEEGWDYIYVNDPQPDDPEHEDYEHWYDDYYVEEVRTDGD